MKLQKLLVLTALTISCIVNGSRPYGTLSVQRDEKDITKYVQDLQSGNAKCDKGLIDSYFGKINKMKADPNYRSKGTTLEGMLQAAVASRCTPSKAPSRSGSRDGDDRRSGGGVRPEPKDGGRPVSPLGKLINDDIELINNELHADVYDDPVDSKKITEALERLKVNRTKLTGSPEDKELERKIAAVSKNVSTTILSSRERKKEGPLDIKIEVTKGLKDITELNRATKDFREHRSKHVEIATFELKKNPSEVESILDEIRKQKESHKNNAAYLQALQNFEEELHSIIQEASKNIDDKDVEPADTTKKTETKETRIPIEERINYYKSLWAKEGNKTTEARNQLRKTFKAEYPGQEIRAVNLFHEAIPPVKTAPAIPPAPSGTVMEELKQEMEEEASVNKSEASKPEVKISPDIEAAAKRLSESYEGKAKPEPAEKTKLATDFIQSYPSVQREEAKEAFLKYFPGTYIIYESGIDSPKQSKKKKTVTFKEKEQKPTQESEKRPERVEYAPAGKQKQDTSEAGMKVALRSKRLLWGTVANRTEGERQQWRKDFTDKYPGDKQEQAGKVFDVVIPSLEESSKSSSSTGKGKQMAGSSSVEAGRAGHGKTGVAQQELAERTARKMDDIISKVDAAEGQQLAELTQALSQYLNAINPKRSEIFLKVVKAGNEAIIKKTVKEEAQRVKDETAKVLE